MMSLTYLCVFTAITGILLYVITCSRNDVHVQSFLTCVFLFYSCVVVIIVDPVVWWSCAVCGCVCMCVFIIADLFVGHGVGKANALDLGPSVSCRTGTTAETRGGVDAAHSHVTGHHWALPTEETQKPSDQFLALIHQWTQIMINYLSVSVTKLMHFIWTVPAQWHTSSTSVQWVPFPSIPSGQGPHFTPSGVSMHFTPGWHGLGIQEGRGCMPPIPEETERQFQCIDSDYICMSSKSALMIRLFNQHTKSILHALLTTFLHETFHPIQV